MPLTCHQRAELHEVISDERLDYSGVGGDTIRDDRPSKLPAGGDVCETFTVAPCADTRLRLSCAKKKEKQPSVKTGSVCARAAI